MDKEPDDVNELLYWEELYRTLSPEEYMERVHEYERDQREADGVFTPVYPED